MQIPRVGRSAATRFLIISAPSIAFKPRIHAANAPTPGTTSPCASMAMCAFDVTTTSIPLVANARSADRKLPDP